MLAPVLGKTSRSPGGRRHPLPLIVAATIFMYRRTTRTLPSIPPLPLFVAATIPLDPSPRCGRAGGSGRWGWDGRWWSLRPRVAAPQGFLVRSRDHW
jgi:hypothetical protein